MSWGTNYKYEGFICRVGMNELEQKLEETHLAQRHPGEDDCVDGDVSSRKRHCRR